MLDDFIKALCYISGKDYDKMPDLRVSLGQSLWVYDDEEPLVIRTEYGYRIAGGYSERDLEKYVKDGYTIKNKPNFGEWFNFGFFTIKGFKKGTGHFKFRDKDLWAMFNQNVARIKGYPLPDTNPKRQKK